MAVITYCHFNQQDPCQIPIYSTGNCGRHLDLGYGLLKLCTCDSDHKLRHVKYSCKRFVNPSWILPDNEDTCLACANLPGRNQCHPDMVKFPFEQYFNGCDRIIYRCKTIKNAKFDFTAGGVLRNTFCHWVLHILLRPWVAKPFSK